MGMDPIAEDETYELTIQVEGPVNRADFKKFRDELKTFLDKVTGDGTAANPGIPNTHPNHKPAKPKLQARESRGGQRKNAP
jgi:hypothetical protein